MKTWSSSVEIVLIYNWKDSSQRLIYRLITRFWSALTHRERSGSRLLFKASRSGFKAWLLSVPVIIELCQPQTWHSDATAPCLPSRCDGGWLFESASPPAPQSCVYLQAMPFSTCVWSRQRRNCIMKHPNVGGEREIRLQSFLVIVNTHAVL